MKTLIYIVFLLYSNMAFTQIQGRLLDSITKKPVKYVNIWVENKDIGTSSDENGNFQFTKIDSTETLIFSSIGYKTFKTNVKNINSLILLQPNSVNLSEILIEKKGSTEIVIQKYKKRKINYYLSCSNKPRIIGRFFIYNDYYEKTPFIKSIKILTKSNIDKAKFNIRLYTTNKEGEPENYLNHKLITRIAKKGKNNTIIDISKLKIEYPENGIFIAIEWLIIENNKYNFSYTMNKEKHKSITYEPSIGTIPANSNKNSWLYQKGVWKKIRKTKSSLKKYNEKYNLIAMELTLSN